MTVEVARFEKVGPSPRQVRHLKGAGVIDYDLYVAPDGPIYIETLKNSGGGRLSQGYYELNLAIKDLRANATSFTRIVADGTCVEDRNETTSGFLKAIVEQLLPGISQKSP